ncbi:MAG TPA: 4-(cytidine 5'-diphospho)-2-C-methyl-D-erythritol kinase [Burkholderiaceae bacterium]|nr:4-(cytidine 5'-diphospho)-2-C-methyl-D-erythritol kinase [Burkholderiaceae bacterium]
MLTEIRHAPAPAKLNLFLHVTGRRPDGYHELETVFQLIDLCDRVHLRRRDDGAILRIGALPGVAPEDDLVVRAARLLQRESGTPLGVEIGLDKTIPMGGGLGGGSSDAATVLLAANRLWGLDWPRERLADVGLALGADVPFFVFGRTAYARGVGERLEPLELPDAWFVVVAPPVSVPTAGVFAAEDLTRDTEPLRISGLSRDGRVWQGRNDLQPVVVRRHPEVAAALASLKEAARAAGLDPALARMSGSGACVFCPVPTEALSGRLAEHVSRSGVGSVRSCRGLARHPLGSRQVG